VWEAGWVMNIRRKTLVTVVTLLLVSELVLAQSAQDLQYEGLYGMQRLAWATLVLALSVIVAGSAISLGLYYGLRGRKPPSEKE